MDALQPVAGGASEIQNYLATFQKEMEDEDESDSYIEQDSDVDGTGLYGPYLSENELDEGIEIKEEPEDDPNFYSSISLDDQNKYLNKKQIGKKGAEIVRLGTKSLEMGIGSGGLSDEDNDNSSLMPVLGEKLHIDDQQTLEMVAQFAEQAVTNATKNTDLAGLDGAASYQTVTIVPSDTNPGELSYVLFVSEDDGLNNILEETGDMSVFDLNEDPEINETFLTKQVEANSKMRTIRLSTRRSQIVTQQHVCAYCSYTSPKRYLLSRHMKSHSDERPHKCGVCGRGFKTLASLQNHVNTHTGTRPHPCRDCDACFTTSGELVRHVRYKHTHEKPHKCTECDYASVELSKLKRHMRCHTGERPYHCPHCTYASPDTYKLKRHLRIHTGEKPYECDICQTRFTQSNSLKAHKLIHSGNKPVFQCEYCPTTCGRKTDLRIHMEKLHSSDKPHRCKRCGKVYLDRYSYKIHVKSHDGEKCFKCDLCEYASMSQRHLETHMLVHTDQKPFRCEACDLCFRQKQLLKRHQNLYHDPDYVRPQPKEKNHVCLTCKKAFRHKGNLMRHFAIHDPEASVSDRESALRLGVPKEPGEDEDGEEDDEIYDYDMSSQKEEDQQVVVFEVIQLPQNTSVYEGNAYALATDAELSTYTGEEQGYSIIQPVDEETSNLFDLNEQETAFEELEEEFVAPKRAARGRGRGRGRSKGSVHLKRISPLKSPSKSRRGRKPGSLSTRVLKISTDESPPVHTASLLDAGAQQMQKEIEECFDFNDKDDVLLASTEESSYPTFQGDLEDIS